MFHSCTLFFNHSWRDDIKSRNILIYHDELFSMIGLGDQEGGQGIETMKSTTQAKMWDSRALSGKITQRSLGGRLEQPGTTVTSMREDSIGRHNCAIFLRRQCGQHELLAVKIAQFSWESMIRLLELLVKTVQFWGIVKAGHDCVVSRLSGVSGSRRIAIENCIVFSGRAERPNRWIP